MENIWEKPFEDFCLELTELSRKYGIGINHEGDFYEMQQEDYERVYKDNGEGKIDFV